MDAEAPIETVVVAGATGYLGRHLVVALNRDGYRVRAITRSRARAEQPGPFGAPALTGLVDEWFVGEVTDPEFVSGTCVGAHRVVSALGVTRQKASPWDVDFLANLRLLQAAEQQGVRSFLYVNVMHAASGRSLIMRAKYAFSQVLVRAGLGHQLVNPSGYFSDIGEFLDMARHGLVVLPPGRDTRIAPIHGADLADFCLSRLPGGSGSWDVGGPDTLTYRDIAELAFEALGTRPRIVTLPRWTLDAAVAAASHLGERPATLARFFADGLTHDAIGTPTGTHGLADYFAGSSPTR